MPKKKINAIFFLSFSLFITMEVGNNDEAFDFSQVISSASAGLEAVLKDKSVQKRKEKRQQEEKEKQVQGKSRQASCKNRFN